MAASVFRSWIERAAPSTHRPERQHRRSASREQPDLRLGRVVGRHHDLAIGEALEVSGGRLAMKSGRGRAANR